MTETLAPVVHHRRWWALAALLVAEAMNLLDTTIVQVAGPTIHTDLGGPVSVIPWVSTAYTLPFAVLLITGGRLGDILGRRRVFRAGVTGFLVASLACALAPSVGLLIAFRAVQGAAAAVIIPQTIGLIRTMFHGSERSRALGTIGPVMGLAAVLGPVLGGVLTHADLFGSSWRAVFLVNVPLSVVVLAIAPLLVENRAPARPRLDPAGTLLAMIGTALIVYPLVEATQPAAWTWVSVGTGLAVLVVFGVVQRRAAGQGLVEVSLFTRRIFPAALVTSTVFFAVTSGLTLVVVLHLQLGLGADVLTAGLTLLPWSVGMGVASLVAGARLVPRYGGAVMFVGLGVLLVGLVGAIAAFTAAASAAALVALGVVGIGVGLFTTSFFTTALHVVEPQEVGSAAGLLNAVQQLGATLGVAGLGSVYLAGAGVQAALWTAVALVLACATAAVAMRT